MFIRPAQPDLDFPRIVELINTVETVPISLEQLQHWHQQMPEGRVCRRMVAVNAMNEVLGYSVVDHAAWAPPGQYYIWVVVKESERGKGMGSALYQEGEAFLRDQKAAHITSEARDEDPLSLSFAGRRGFTVDRHLFESQLNLKTFDESPYLAALTEAEKAGIRFTSMAELGDDPKTRRKLYQLNRLTSLDIPGADDTFMSFETFLDWICAADWYRPEGQILALDGKAWAGLAAVQLIPQTRSAYNLMTGVAQGYRGRKIATAVKLQAIRYAMRNGARTMRTSNDSLNAPMLAINQKLGYQPQPGKYILSGNLN